MIDLTPAQQAVFDYCQTYIDTYGRKPFTKEIAAHLGIGKQTVRDRLLWMERKGLVLTKFGWLNIEAGKQVAR